MGRDKKAEVHDEALTLALLDTLLHTAPVGMGFVDADLRFVRVNEVLAAMNGASVEDHVGRRVDEVLTGLADTLVPILTRTLETGVPSDEIEVKAGPADDQRWVISYYPVREGQGPVVGVGVVVRDVTEQRRAAEELDTRARHLGALAELGQRALIVDDFDGLLHEGAGLLGAILGADFVDVLEHDPDAGQFVLRLAQGFGAEVGTRLSAGVDVQAGFALHHRMPVAVPDVGQESRFTTHPAAHGLEAQASLTVVIRGPGRPFGVLGVSSKSPREFRSAEVDFVQSMANVLGTAAARARIDAALRSERERLRLALDAGGLGDWEWDMDANQVSWSDSLHEIYGLAPGEFDGSFEQYVSLIHPDDRQHVRDTIDAALQGGLETYTVEHRVVTPDGSTRWVAGQGIVRRKDDGTPFGMIGVSSNITDRAEAEYKQTVLFAAEQEARTEAEAARDRLEFLAEASEVLASSLDYRATLSQVAYLAVSRLADWCAVDIVEEEGDLPTTVALAHIDPDKIAMAADFRAKYPPDPYSDEGVGGVIRSGQPYVIPMITEEMLIGAALEPDHLEAIRALRLTSSMIVPLVARGRTLGAITLITAESGRVYADDDLALAMDLARRAAVAIDNARLYRERSQVAEALQRSLLPPSSPEIPGLEVAVRYRPIGQGAEIGGDFYDVFEASESSWVVVIGDVCGKGTAAAALTGLARDTIRGVSIRERAPRRVLRVLNEVVVRRQDEDPRFLTVALARLEVDASGARMLIACGGHPLPLLLRADGTLEEAGAPGMLLGLFPDVDPADVSVELRPGDAVVFYTDGVTEARGEDGQFGEGWLRALL
ncbi:MAG: hypothetical protein QOI20_1565 [Acidimicrobiaceae bacterium]|nr:hypothetical protein [Acidimicrobiaceae bacterium]